MYHRLLFPPLVASQLPRTAPGRPGGCRPLPWGRCTIGCSSLPWWPPSSPGQLRAGRAAAGLLHGEDGRSVCSPLPWWPPSSPGLLRAGRAAAGRLHGEDGRSVCSPLPWWPPSSPGLLQAGRAAAGRLHGEDVPSAALPSPGGLPAPQGSSGSAGRLPAVTMGKVFHKVQSRGLNMCSHWI